jgi:hypothetical protein
MEYDTVIKVINGSENPVDFVLEPWGEIHRMAPEDVFVLAAKGPEGDTFEVIYEKNSICVWGWPGSVVWLFHNEKELGAGSGPRTPVPRIPRPQK